MTLKFIRPTLAQILRVLSCAIALTDTLLAYSATIHALPWIPASVAMYYPTIFGVALVIHQTASIFDLSPDASMISEIRAVALEAAQIAGTIADAEKTSSRSADTSLSAAAPKA